jgi:hypothetical protein
VDALSARGRRALRLAGVLLAVYGSLAGGRSAASCLDAALWGGILARYSAEVPDAAGVRVDYRALAVAPEWRRLVAGLAECDPRALGSPAETLAFWINAYNVLAIDVVVAHYPVGSIRDAGSLLRPVWKRPAGRIGGRERTLDEVEHDILRPLGDPRIHAAIVCASTSCPSLRREPYEAARIDAQLDDALRRFLADPRKGAAFDPATGRLRLSPIFAWFEEDFATRGGVLAFLLPRLPEEIRTGIAARRDAVRVEHFDYDWRLNDLARTGRP